MKKAALRQLLLQQRRRIPPPQHRAASQQLRKHLLTHVLKSLPPDALVTSYVPIAGEPAVPPPWLAEAGCHLALPAVDGKQLHFRRWQPGDPLQPDICGVPAPLATAPAVAAEVVDLLLIPAVAMHPAGLRLGYGGGWYDRLHDNTTWCGVPSLGVCFARFTRVAFPADDWDRPLHGSLSEAGVHWWQPPPWLRN